MFTSEMQGNMFIPIIIVTYFKVIEMTPGSFREFLQVISVRTSRFRSAKAQKTKNIPLQNGEWSR